MSGYNGNGVFSFTYLWTLDAANGVPITASRMDTEFADATGGFNLVICRDGQSTTTAAIPFAVGINTDTVNPVTLLGPVSYPAGQIKFPATQNPSTDANTLDDYEEGTFTPVITGGTVAGTFTYTLQIGSYIKTGKQVSFTLRVAWSNYASVSGIVQISLPFLAKTLTSEVTIVNLVADNVTFDSGYTQSCGVISSNSQVVVLNEMGSNKALNQNGISNVATAGAFYISGTYFASA